MMKGDTLILSQIYGIITQEVNDMAKKKELKQIVFSWHKAAGVLVEWNNNEITYTSDDDYVIVAIQAEIEAYSNAADTMVLGAQLTYDSAPFSSLTGAVAEVARRRCLMAITTASSRVTSGGNNFWQKETIVFPEDCRPELDEDDQLNLHVFSAIADKGGQVTFILHVYEK